MVKQLTISLVISISLCLAACGFQLRNHQALAEPLQTLYLQADNPYGSLETNLRQTLHTSGVTLVKSASAAPITLHLFRPNKANFNAIIGPSGQTRSYTLVYEVTYTLTNAQGKLLVGPEKLQASRNLILSANQLLQSNNQADILNREMERDIINQLYNRLRSKQITAKLKS